MDGGTIFFAGGGTGGHIYPAIAIAEKISELAPKVRIHFFCSKRDIDARILDKTGFKYTPLTARGLSIRPRELFRFCKSFYTSYVVAARTIAENRDTVVVGVGGYVSGPVCLAAHRLKVPLRLVNVDIVPGRANKLVARWAREIFVQFEETAQCFSKTRAKITAVGCPLRSAFDNPRPSKAIEQLGLSSDKNTLLITGASSGSAGINAAVCLLLDKLAEHAESWQVVHLTGHANLEEVNRAYTDAKIKNVVLDYYDDMGSLLAAADLVIGRSGAVSIAEYAAAAVPSICIPYPYHKDLHQYLNAGKLVEAGAGIIVDDLPDEKDRAEWLWEELEQLMTDNAKRREMKNACQTLNPQNAATRIAKALIEASR